MQLVFPDDVRQGDVFVLNGRIVDIGPSLNPSAAVVIADSGLTLMPGVIDTHVHFREPGAVKKETIRTGSRAAASGGVTTFFDMPNNHPPTTTLAAFAEKKAIAAESSVINYNFYIGATLDNIDVLIQADNCPGIKIFMGSSTGDMLVDDPVILDGIFNHANKPIVIHSEDETIIRKNLAMHAGSTDVRDHMAIRSPDAALACTKRAVTLAKKYRQRLHILHLTTAEEVDWLLEQALPDYITAEVCIQHLLLHAPTVYDRLGTFAQINPPLRTEYHASRLWYGLQQGVIASIVTDHAPHLMAEKSLPFGEAPSGMPGVETLLPLVLTVYNHQRCTLPQVTRWLSGAAHALFNIEQRGILTTGFYADFAIVDLKKRWTASNDAIESACGWTAFDGWPMIGKPIMTVVNGQIVWREGQHSDQPLAAQEVRILGSN